MSAPASVSVPTPAAGLCESCQVRPARQLVYLPTAADGSSLGAAPYRLGELLADLDEDYFRICGAACSPDGR